MLLVAGWPTVSRAACSGPAGVAGAVIYNGDYHIPQYCNDVNWVAMANPVNVPTTNGLVAYWKFDDGSGTNAIDSSGNGYTGALVGSPPWTAGYYSGALTFDGSSQYVATGFNQTLGDFTVCAWFNSGSDAASSRIVDKSSSGGFWLGHEAFGAANKWGGGVEESGSPDGIFVTLTDGAWHQLCSVRQGTTHTIYGDGGAVSASNTVSAAALDTSLINIGGGSSGSNLLTGSVDDVRVYSRALSAAEISTLYNYHISPPSGGLAGWWKFDENGGTAAADSSGNGNTGTLVNGPVFTSAGKLAGALTFDGIDDYAVGSETVNYTTTFSIAAWFKTTVGGAIASGLCRTLISTNGSQLLADTNSCSGSWPSYAVFGHTNIVDGAWHFGVFVIDGLNLRLYVDGKLDGAATQPDTTFAGSATNYIGQTGMGWSNQYFTGTIDDVRLYSRALSADEIYGLYRTSSPVCASPAGYEGDVMYNGGSNHVLQFCDNANWRALGPVPGAGGGVCISPAGNEGDTIYSDSTRGSGVMQYCDGAKWVQIGGPSLPTSGLVGYWKFDEGSGTSAADSSGKGNTGTLANSPTWTTTGKDAGALTLNGTSQYVTVPDSASLNLSGSWTASAWVNVTSLPGSGARAKIVIREDTSTFANYSLSIVNNASCSSGVAWRAHFDDSGGSTYATCYATTINTGVWYHVASVWDSSTSNLMIYLNGSLVATQNFTGHVPVADAGADLRLGADGAGSDYFNGTIDDTRIYNRALSAPEIWQLYNGT